MLLHLICAIIALIGIECFIRADAREQRRHAEAIRSALGDDTKGE